MLCSLFYGKEVIQMFIKQYHLQLDLLAASNSLDFLYHSFFDNCTLTTLYNVIINNIVKMGSQIE